MVSELQNMKNTKNKYQSQQIAKKFKNSHRNIKKKKIFYSMHKLKKLEASCDIIDECSHQIIGDTMCYSCLRKKMRKKYKKIFRHRKRQKSKKNTKYRIREYNGPQISYNKRAHLLHTSGGLKKSKLRELQKISSHKLNNYKIVTKTSINIKIILKQTSLPVADDKEVYQHTNLSQYISNNNYLLTNQNYKKFAYNYHITTKHTVNYLYNENTNDKIYINKKSEHVTTNEDKKIAYSFCMPVFNYNPLLNKNILFAYGEYFFDEDIDDIDFDNSLRLDIMDYKHILDDFIGVRDISILVSQYLFVDMKSGKISYININGYVDDDDD